ncbi:YolD-like family protein [Bhargavaea beijingensis]|uniref:YolD-like family protein n=1 Tax=Bhargavaea beijingensis TaxID=426756 RepID=UPI0022255213|nr:YolD-like family protein [Bhargavaea beijingensis]MCW1929526.1 YolD-like family protein [Bhargavaea beijingensis]
MLPEHLRELRKWQAEDDLVKQPDLSEWDLRQIQQEIDRAIRSRELTEVQTWRDGILHRHTGVIVSADISSQRIRLDEEWIEVAEIVHINVLE